MNRQGLPFIDETRRGVRKRFRRVFAGAPVYGPPAGNLPDL
jgi:hypothetical protein